MTKKNLIITIILLSVIDLVAAGWYTSRRIEASGRSQNLFEQRDSAEVIAMADTVTSTFQDDVFDDLQHNTYYYIANTPCVSGDNSSCYTSIKHVKVRWPKNINGNDELTDLNKELIDKAFGNSQSNLKDARYVYLNTPTFNKPVGDDYQKLVKAPKIVPVYGNVSQVLVYPFMTSQRLLVMEVDKVEYNGNTSVENSTYVHYDRQNQRVLSRVDILVTDFEKESKLLKLINKKIDDLNKSRGDNKLQHALNVPAEVCCGKKGVNFLYKQGTISNTPIEIMVDYDKMEPFFTKEFRELLKNNEDYAINKDKIEPEPINPPSTPKPAAVAQPVKKKKSSSRYNYGYKHKGSSDSYNNDKSDKNKYGNKYKKKYRRSKKKYYNNYGNKQQFTPKQTSRRHYNGAKRKSGRYGYAGRRH